MSEAPLANSEAARSPTGEILSQNAAGLETKTPSSTATTDQTTKTTEQSGDTSKTQETSTKPALKEGETLLTSQEEGKKDETAKGPPERYADFKLPEGVALDTKILEQALPVFKELGLTQDQAQRLIDLDIERTRAAGDPMKPYNDMRADWQAKTTSDPDIAKVRVGDKSGLDAVKINVAKIHAALGNPQLSSEFKAAMDLTGAGDHPAFVKFLNKLSEFVTEGRSVTGSGPSAHGQLKPGDSAKPSIAGALYPNLPR